MTTASLQTSISLVIRDKVAEISLNGPEGKPPTLDQSVMDDLESAIMEIGRSDVRLAFLLSNSAKFFCVGANIQILKETNTETIGPWVRNGHRVLNLLEDLHCPVVADVRGYVMGGGLELALACDLIFSSANARFAQSEARLGFIPGWGGSRRLAMRLGHAKAKYLFYSGSMLDAAKALDWGLVEFCGTDEELDAFKKSFEDDVMQSSAYACTTFKKILNRQVREERERNEQEEAINSIGCLEDPETLRRLQEFLSKKK